MARRHALGACRRWFKSIHSDHAGAHGAHSREMRKPGQIAPDPVDLDVCGLS